jgi:hypothetical protein
VPPAPLPTTQLTERAAALRRAAAAIDDCDALVLYRRAGTDTWIGPTPQTCHDELVAARTTLIGASASLRAAAIRLEKQAIQLTAANARAGAS